MAAARVEDYDLTPRGGLDDGVFEVVTVDFAEVVEA